jgi:DNA topoisomerase-3
MLSDNDVVDLLNGETIGPYSDFRSKRGKPFTASVKLVNNKIEFMFADSMAELDIEAIKKSPSLGVSPIDGTKVFDTPMAYLSESALDGETKKGLRISKIILSKEITAENIKQLLTAGKTELITGFISKRRKPFEAYLILAKNGTVSFEFPPRKTKSKE